jgi:hypothetical protein
LTFSGTLYETNLETLLNSSIFDQRNIFDAQRNPSV